MLRRWIWLLLVLFWTGLGVAEERVVSSTLWVEAEPERGFCWPYFLYIPPQCVTPGEQQFSLLVAPNNSGKTDDDPEVHRRLAQQDVAHDRQLADQLGCPVLVPTFPRPAAQWQLYTHALDRDTLLKGSGNLARLDQQLLAMIEHCRSRLATKGIRLRSKIWMDGFSASAMFVNRFALLHPEAVDRVAAGGPGGWPMAPVEKSGGKSLPYPVGSADIITLTGKPLQLEAARRVHFLFYLGDQDEDDSVAYDDGYDRSDRELIGSLFGHTPVERWPQAEKLYKLARMQAEFKLYPGVGHLRSAEMLQDLVRFFSQSNPSPPS